MNIVILTPGFPPWRLGGEEYYTYYQAVNLVEFGHKIFVIAENRINKKTGIINIEKNLKIALIKSINTKSKLLNTLIILFYYIFSFNKIKKIRRISLIHGHDTLGPGLSAVILGKIYRIPVFITWHGAELLGNNFSLLGDISRKIVCKYANGIIVSSKLFKKLALKNVGMEYKNKFTIIPPAVDVKEFSPKKSGETIRKNYELSGSLLILSVGRLERVKGFDTLLNSMPEVVKKIPNVKFMIVGTGSLKENLINLSNKLGISDNVIFTESIPRDILPYYYSACDIFVLPTRSEGFGMVFLEAWSSGKPIITTPQAPIIANLVNKYGGGIVSENESSKLSAAILKLLSNENLRSEMGKKGREISLNFSWRNMVKKNISFYNARAR